MMSGSVDPQNYAINNYERLVKEGKELDFWLEWKFLGGEVPIVNSSDGLIDWAKDNWPDNLPLYQPFSDKLEDIDESGEYEYFFRAMSFKEFAKTLGTLQHRTREDGTLKGAGPFITQDKEYLKNPLSFIKGKQAKKYNLIIRYKVPKGTASYLEENSISDQKPGSTTEAIRGSKVIRKREKGGVRSFGFPGKSGNKHFNPKIKGMIIIPISN